MAPCDWRVSKRRPFRWMCAISIPIMLRRGSRRVPLASNSLDISRFIGSLRVTTVHVPPANRLLGANYGIQKRRFSH
eukprot:5715458-Prorocentrum_lima.AAC.1